MVFKTQYIVDFELSNVVKTIQDWISKYDLGLLESVSILRLNETIHYYGICEKPITNEDHRYLGGYRIRCAINERIEYPTNVPADSLLFGNDGYPDNESLEPVVIFDQSEFCIWLFGRTIHEYIKCTDMLDTELETADEFSLRWLELWRKTRAI